MGKAYRWFRSILGLNKSDSRSTTARNSKEKRGGRWSFVKSYREKENNNYNKQSVLEKSGSLYVPAKPVIVDEYEKDEDENHHALAMAEATAAVAEAALAAAQAAVAVVRLTSSSGRCATTTDSHVSVHPSGNLGVLKEFERSAIQIQSVFRGFLARKALRALKGLVKLQALVRGHIERKRTADWLHRVQSLVRAQVRARAGRVMSFDSSHSTCKSSHLFQHDPQTPEKVEPPLRVKGVNYEGQLIFKRDGSKSNGRLVFEEDKFQVAQYRLDRKDERPWENQKTSSRSRSANDDKTRKYKNLFHSAEQYSHSSRDSTIYRTVQSSMSYEVQSMSPMEQPYYADEGYRYKSPFTPTKSDVSVSSYTSGFTDHPNYMSYTESSRAKLRSLSAPKQRPHYEKSSSDKLYFGESRSGLQKISVLQANFASKAYPGSGRLDRLGMPVKCIY